MIKTPNFTLDVTNQTNIMGILNVTPDSFSDGGKYTTEEKAIAQAVKMEREGAHIIDIGGESTRPDHDPVPVEEEINRVVPMIQAVKEHISIPISIDTYKAETARKAIEAGAEVINDVWGAKKDPEIADVAKEYNVPIVLMHNRASTTYSSIIDDMKEDLEESIDIAVKRGVREENIILDPGIGFAKDANQNLVVMNNLEKISAMGYPLLLATSRKRFIGAVLDVPASERDYGTGATTCLGIVKGARIIRVHHVQLHVQLAKMMDAMLQERI